MKICVYCGSKEGLNPYYKEIASQVGERIAARGATILCGGTASGLMGIVAESALAKGGQVVGVLELTLMRLGEKAHPGLTSLHLVENPLERKQKMSIMASRFLLLPGGMGSIEELFDVWSEVRLQMHHKPIALFNMAGYFDGLLSFIDHMIAEGFLDASYKKLLQIIESFDDLEEFLK